MLRELDLLALRNRHLHAAGRAAAFGHGGHHDVALLVEAQIEALHLRVELVLELGDRVVERVQVAAVPGLVVFVTGEHELLELAEDVDLAFHYLLSV